MEGESSLVPLRFTVDLRTNSVIAVGSPSELRIIEALVLRLDEKDVQQRETAVYRLKNAPALDVSQAVNDFLRSQRQVQSATPGVLSPFQQIEAEVVVVPEPVSNTLILSATPRFFKEIAGLVEKLDAQPAQVVIQVFIADVQLSSCARVRRGTGPADRGAVRSQPALRQPSDDHEHHAAVDPFGHYHLHPADNAGRVAHAGIQLQQHSTTVRDASYRAVVGLRRHSGHPGPHRLRRRPHKQPALGFGGLVLSASSDAVSVLIRALQATQRVDVLSRPQITTLDNQPAYVQIGQRVPRITGSMSPQLATGGIFNTFDMVNVGLILGVTPRISPEGMVVMEIDAENSSLAPEAEGIPVAISAGTVIRSPSINTTNAQTTVSVADGETILLGGLITKSTTKIDSRVPLLADVPLLGNLFKYDSVAALRHELLIILTPHVVRTPAEAERIKRMESCADELVLGGCGGDPRRGHRLETKRRQGRHDLPGRQPARGRRKAGPGANRTGRRCRAATGPGAGRAVRRPQQSASASS